MERVEDPAQVMGGVAWGVGWEEPGRVQVRSVYQGEASICNRGTACAGGGAHEQIGCSGAGKRGGQGTGRGFLGLSL